MFNGKLKRQMEYLNGEIDELKYRIHTQNREIAELQKVARNLKTCAECGLVFKVNVDFSFNSRMRENILMTFGAPVKTEKVYYCPHCLPKKQEEATAEAFARNNIGAVMELRESMNLKKKEG